MLYASKRLEGNSKPDIVVLKVPKMDLSFSAEHAAFQDEVRTFIEENLPADIRDKGYRGLKIEKEDVARWHRTLYEKGWAAPAWPKNMAAANGMPFAFTYLTRNCLARMRRRSVHLASRWWVP